MSCTRELLPAPVPPMTATVWPALTERVMSRRTFSPLAGSYLKETCSKGDVAADRRSPAPCSSGEVDLGVQHLHDALVGGGGAGEEDEHHRDAS